LPRGWPGGAFWFGWGRGFGNPYPFCRWFPWLPRWWWAHPAFTTMLYYGAPRLAPYAGYWPASRIWPYGYFPYMPYY